MTGDPPRDTCFLLALTWSHSWKCKKQPTIALSTTETEYMATSHCTKEAVWLKQLMADVEYLQEGPDNINFLHFEHRANLSPRLFVMYSLQFVSLIALNFDNEIGSKLAFSPTSFMCHNISVFPFSRGMNLLHFFTGYE